MSLDSELRDVSMPRLRASPVEGRVSSADAQRVRIRRFYMAAATSIAAVVLFYGCYLTGLLAWGVLLNAAVATFVLIAVFYAMFRTGLNMKFEDPTVLLPQAACSIVVTSYVMAYAGPARAMLMILYFAAFLFYAFRFSKRDYIMLCLFTGSCYACVVFAAARVDPDRARLSVDLLQGFFLLVALPWLGWMASYLSGLRRRLRTGEALYRAIWDSSIDAVLIFDQQGQVRFANPAAGRLFNYQETALLGLPLASLQPEDRREELGHEIRAYLLDGSVGRDWRRFEDAILTHDGREVPVEAAMAELGGPGGTPGLFSPGERRVVLFLRNISERRALETIKDDFISTVSHELRTPLTSVIGAVEALQAGAGGDLSDTSRALIDMAASSADRLHLLIDTILDLQKIETGGITFAPEAVPAGNLIRAAVEGERFAPAGGRLTMAELPPSVRVKADARWVHKVLEHLIDNALKFSPAGSPVTVGAERGEHAVRFMVRDEGPGVPPQFAARIFGKFAQADASNTRVRGGAGLGLSFSKSIVEGCGGRIGYQNNADRGATFWFELPHAR